MTFRCLCSLRLVGWGVHPGWAGISIDYTTCKGRNSPTRHASIFGPGCSGVLIAQYILWLFQMRRPDGRCIPDNDKRHLPTLSNAPTTRTLSVSMFIYFPSFRIAGSWQIDRLHHCNNRERERECPTCTCSFLLSARIGKPLRSHSHTKYSRNKIIDLGSYSAFLRLESSKWREYRNGVKGQCV